LPRKIAAGLESVYSVRARRRFAALLERVKPDVVYTLNITNMLTPSIVYEAHRRGVPVISRVSDYGLTCAAYGYFRDGHVCFDCRASLTSALRHRCVQGSLPVTALRVLSIGLHRQLGFLQQVAAFIAPSRFMADDLRQLGVPNKRVHYLATPIWDLDGLARVAAKSQYDVPAVAYIGRISPEKGIDVLLRAWAGIHSEARLMIIGQGAVPAAPPNVEVVGPCYGDELLRRMASADIVVVPSLSPDNAPNVVIEALGLGKPVIASDVGGIPDQLDETCSLLVPAGDAHALTASLDRLLADAELRCRMGVHARARAEKEFRPEPHVDHLEEIFSACVAE
jgi:glycosyltransferase involved in cell wall biosynthesis